jgi:PIN domain nuclease of toxin-antitoxin system
VLDASAVLAYLKREPGYERVRETLANGAAISTVNLAEVYAKVVASGQPLDSVAARLLGLGAHPEPFTEQDARTSAALYQKTQPLGFSLGDRACLALGIRLDLPVFTTDHAWAQADLSLDVRVIR